jgi:NADH:ubiquinone oxidoreductase subunit E
MQRDDAGSGLSFSRKDGVHMSTPEGSLDDLFARYKGQQGTLIPLLQQAQERYGYLPAAAIEEIARFARLSPSEVYGVVTFYAQFRLTPPGETTVKVCQGTACHVKGAKRILEEVEAVLNVKAGGTTDDRKYSVERIACFGACSLAPVVVVGKTVHGRLTPTKVKKLLQDSKQ